MDNRELDHLVERTFFSNTNAGWGSLPPHYTESIEAAWRIVEEMGRRGFTFRMRCYFVPEHATATSVSFEDKEQFCHTATAKTPSKAIVMAALRTQGLY